MQGLLSEGASVLEFEIEIDIEPAKTTWKGSGGVDEQAKIVIGN